MIRFIACRCTAKVASREVKGPTVFSICRAFNLYRFAKILYFLLYNVFIGTFAQRRIA